MFDIPSDSLWHHVQVISILSVYDYHPWHHVQLLSIYFPSVYHYHPHHARWNLDTAQNKHGWDDVVLLLDSTPPESPILIDSLNPLFFAPQCLWNADVHLASPLPHEDVLLCSDTAESNSSSLNCTNFVLEMLCSLMSLYRVGLEMQRMEATSFNVFFNDRIFSMSSLEM